jgi:HlyD family secretion protein
MTANQNKLNTNLNMSLTMNSKEKITLIITGIFVGILVGIAIMIGWKIATAPPKEIASTVKPALTVSTVKPATSMVNATFNASGSVNAWQDSIIGAESQGLRINDVRVNVGSQVQKGQVLATFAPETVAAELAQSKASVTEAEAALAEASANADRAKMLDASGALSQQQINQYLTLAKTAEARLAAARAQAKVAEVRLSHTQVLAPDSGTISARLATVGAVVQSGQELFRMVRQNRLEWRAEVTAAELPNINVGQKVSITTPAGEKVAGTVRMIAPTIDPQTRNVQVYVDLSASKAAKAGMFARGEFQLSDSNGLLLPQQAIVMRDGFSYVFVLTPDNHAKQVKVETGRRVSDRIEVKSGVDAATSVIATGAGFLKDGDLVRVLNTSNAATAPTPSAASASSATKK